ncbi:MAG TPA: hypothetical protein VNI55_01925 [Gaiellaceae bacterium]|nr:hypothetical protein [Gaiellaceae bacterium]
MSERTYTLSPATMSEIARTLEGGRIGVAQLHEIVERNEPPRFRAPVAATGEVVEMSDADYDRAFALRFGGDAIGAKVEDDGYAETFAARFGQQASV